MPSIELPATKPVTLVKTNKWKMLLLVWSAMFPFSTAVSYGLAQLSFTAHWPLVARTFCLTCLIVPYMIFGAFPLLNRYFKKWLQLESGSPDTQKIQVDTASSSQSSGFYSEVGKLEQHEQYARLTTNRVSA